MSIVEIVPRAPYQLTIQRVGTQGVKGEQGGQGDAGWSPVLANVEDGERRVQRIADWVGGEGGPPEAGGYIGPAGLVSDIAEATDIRGAPGDMDSSVYDPEGNAADAFARANHTGTQPLSTISDVGAAAALNVGATAGTVAAGDHTHPAATPSTPGFMSAEDKTKLDGAREVLPANRTYYVRTDGSNSNNGLSNTSGGAFLTLLKAADAIATLDFNGFTVTVQIGDGTYTGTCVVPVTVGQSATSKLVFKGNTTMPGNVVISVTGGDCFSSVAGARALIQDMELRTTTSGSGINAGGVGSELQWSNIRFGACAANQVLAQGGALATCVGNYSIVGNAVQHLNSDRGLIEIGSKTVTLTGTPAFSVAFVNASQGHVRAFLNTYTGSATGSRYRAVLNGTINTFGAGATALPGDAVGTTATGGQYA